MNESKHIAIVGAGMAAIACARTLVQAGHQVSVFEKSHGLGGRMSTRNSPFGTFDHGAQYFTVRDARFQQALADVATIDPELGRIFMGIYEPYIPSSYNPIDEGTWSTGG